MTIVRRATLRRVLASFMLAGLVLSLAAPSLLSGARIARDCPLAPGSGARGPALVHAMPDDGACDRSDAGACLGTLGCVIVSPAIAIVPTLLVVPNRLIVLNPRPAPHFGDLFRTGPPTPPPDLI